MGRLMARSAARSRLISRAIDIVYEQITLITPGRIFYFRSPVLLAISS